MEKVTEKKVVAKKKVAKKKTTKKKVAKKTKEKVAEKIGPRKTSGEFNIDGTISLDEFVSTEGNLLSIAKSGDDSLMKDEFIRVATVALKSLASDLEGFSEKTGVAFELKSILKIF